MPLNKFGQSLQGQSNTNSILSKLQYGGRGLKYTVDGNIDAENLKISNVKLPTLSGDAANRQYVENNFTTFYNDIMKSLKQFEQDTIKSIKTTEQKTRADYNKCAEDLKKLNKQTVKIITDLDSLKHISTADVKVHADMSVKISKLQNALDASLKDIAQEIEKNKAKSAADLLSLRKTAVTRSDYTALLNIFEDMKSEYRNAQADIKNSLLLVQANQKNSITTALDDIDKRHAELKTTIFKIIGPIHNDFLDIKFTLSRLDKQVASTLKVAVSPNTP